MTNLESDEARAIMAVIRAETAAYLAKDHALWASYWVRDERALRWSSYPWSGVAIDRGWEMMSEKMRLAMAAHPEPLEREIRIENLTVEIGGEMAWVTYDEFSDHQEDPFDIGPLHRNLKILLRIRGAWKIVCISDLSENDIADHCPLVTTDPKGKILSSNALAEAELASHAHLMVSQGRLRARRRAADKALQVAIGWAGSLDHYAPQRHALKGHATGGRLPVIIGEDEKGETSICWVAPRHGSVRLTFSDEQTLAHRLGMAGVVFHLSPAQVKLARLIVRGLDTAEAAAVLGVSSNTTRTRLRRIFEKTGVHTQSALVRVLLSTGAGG